MSTRNMFPTDQRQAFLLQDNIIQCTVYPNNEFSNMQIDFVHTNIKFPDQASVIGISARELTLL